MPSGAGGIPYFSSGSEKRRFGAVWPEAVESENTEAVKIKRLAKTNDLIAWIKVVESEVWSG